MYYGELCVKVKKCGDMGSITFYTRARKKKVLPPDEQIHVGESIEISTKSTDTLRTILLDTYALISRGMCKKYRSEDGVITWSLTPSHALEVMSGPVIMTFMPKKGHIEMSIECYGENCMETTKLGCIRFSETGDISFVQKLMAALNVLDVTPQEARDYKRTIGEL